jgi:hypothetical protein
MSNLGGLGKAAADFKGQVESYFPGQVNAPFHPERSQPSSVFTLSKQ